MFSRTLIVRSLGLLAFSLATAASLGASPKAKHTTYLTFNRPISLPGVTLGAGTYIFENPGDDSDRDLVRVLSRDRSKIYLTTFTRAVERPGRMKRDLRITFGEPSAEGAMPVLVWWPEETQGHQFVYPTR